MKVWIQRLLLLIALVAISLTPFYGIAYLVALGYGARHLKFSRTFSTLVGHLVLSLLFFAATIMLVGLIAWLLHIPIPPIAVVAGYVALVEVIRRTKPADESQNKFMDRGDVIALALALIAPAILLGSFYLPKPSHAATYQLLGTAWDHGPHLNMLQNTSDLQGYFYGPTSDDMQYRETKEAFRAYPQAWHLASSHLTNGFGVNVFNPKNPLLSMYGYIAVMLGWYVITVYSFSRLAWRLLRNVLPTNESRKPSWTIVTLFVMASLLLQLVIFIGDLTWAFVNYTACIAYLILFASFIIDKNKASGQATYIGALLAGTAATLCWFLPLPAIGLALILGFLSWNSKLLPQLQLILRPTKKNIAAMALTVISVASILFQLAIFFLFSPKGGGALLNTEGAYPPPNDMLLLIVLSASLLFWVYAKHTMDEVRLRFLAITAPMAAFALVIYVYQLNTAGETTYYLFKITGLLWVLVGAFFIPAFVVAMTRFTRNTKAGIAAVLMGLSVISLLVVATNQPLEPYNRLFRQQSKVANNVAGELIRFIKTADPEKESIVVMRGMKRTEDFNANFISYVFNGPSDCTRRFVSHANSYSLASRIEGLDKCAIKIPEKQITVLTSSRTEKQITELNHPNIHVVNVPVE